MQIIPISDVYSQTIPSVQLAGQNCQINLYQKSTGFYCDLFVNNSPIVTGRICQNLNRIVGRLYMGFVGDLMFIDQQGTFAIPSTGLDPSSPGLGTRYLLCYLSTADLNGQG